MTTDGKQRARKKLPRLTKIQRETLQFIADWIEQEPRRRSPTLKRIAAHFGVSKITIWERIESLKTKMVLTGEPQAHFSLEVTESGKAVLAGKTHADA